MARLPDLSQPYADLGESSLSPEIQILLAVSLPPLTAGVDDGLSRLLENEVDWAFLLLAAYRHGLLPLLHARLRKLGGTAAPLSVKLQLSKLAERNGRKIQNLTREHARLSAVLSAAGVRALSPSMPALLRFYEDPMERQAEPIEFCVQPIDASRARKALLAEGLRSVHALTESRELVLLSQRYLPLHEDAHDLRIHLQSRLLPRFAPDVLKGTAWQDEVAGPGPSPELLLLRACLAGSLHGWTRLIWIADVARIVEGATLDWQGMFSTLEDETARRMLLLGLRLSNDLLATELPAEVHAAMTSDPRIAVLARQVLDRLQRDRRGYTLESERMRYRLQLVATPVSRARFLLRFATTPDIDDLKIMRLPAPAYALLRPLRLLSSLGLHAARRTKPAPYYSTPPNLIEHMLDLADVGPNDAVFDLGCGDGRVVIAAAKRGARAVGIDLNPKLIVLAKSRALEEGVAERASFYTGDLMQANVDEATVVFLWLSPRLNLALRPRLQAKLRPGARIVSQAFDMGDWLPESTELFVGENDEVWLAYLWHVSAAPQA